MGHYPVCTRWQRGRWKSSSKLSLTLSYKAFGGQTHPFSWTGFHGCYQIRMGIGWRWRRGSLEISLQQNSWQLPPNSIANCYSLCQGKSCIVAHIGDIVRRVQGKLIGSQTGEQSHREQEKCSCNELDILKHLTWASSPYPAKAKRKREFNISLHFSSHEKSCSIVYVQLLFCLS